MRMKKIVSGLFLSLISFLGMIIPIAISIPLTSTLKSWSGSRLWYILFSPEFLNLKFFFFGCLFIFIVGLALVLIECFHKE